MNIGQKIIDYGLEVEIAEIILEKSKQYVDRWYKFSLCKTKLNNFIFVIERDSEFIETENYSIWNVSKWFAIKILSPKNLIVNEYALDKENIYRSVEKYFSLSAKELNNLLNIPVEER